LNRSDSLNGARVILEHARALNPLNTDHTANLARLYRRWADLATDAADRKAKLEQAGTYYQQATTLSPHNAQLWNEWSTVYLALHDVAQQAGDTAQAEADLKEAQAKLDQSLALDTEYDLTYIYLAQLARFQGNTAEAQKNYELALKWNPNNSDAWSGLSDMLVSAGNYTAVESITLAYLNNNPNFAPALRTLARNVYAPEQRLAEAIGAEQRVIQSSPNDPNIWDDHRVLAILLAETGQLPQALQEAQTALSQAPQTNQADIQNLINQLQAQLGGGPTPTPAPTPTP
jgi:tetratricopeptide (TPR) repeat protein